MTKEDFESLRPGDVIAMTAGTAERIVLTCTGTGGVTRAIHLATSRSWFGRGHTTYIRGDRAMLRLLRRRSSQDDIRRARSLWKAADYCAPGCETIEEMRDRVARSGTCLATEII